MELKYCEKKIDSLKQGLKLDTGVLAIIPARSGSKSVSDKNIRIVAGKPLLAWSILHAKESKYITRIIVSTDSKKYASIARKYGAETPFIRPHDIAGDRTPDIDVFMHALNWLARYENYCPEIIVHLRPTCPIRKPKTIDAMIQLMLDRSDIDSVRTIAASPLSPFKSWLRSEHGFLKPIVNSQNIREPYNMPRQMLPTTWLQTACIDITRRRIIIEHNSMTGKNIFGWVSNHFLDIDYEYDFLLAEVALNLFGNQGDNPTKCEVISFEGHEILRQHTESKKQGIILEPLRMNLIIHLLKLGHQIVITLDDKTNKDRLRSLIITRLKHEGISLKNIFFESTKTDWHISSKMLSPDLVNKIALISNIGE